MYTSVAEGEVNWCSIIIGHSISTDDGSVSVLCLSWFQTEPCMHGTWLLYLAARMIDNNRIHELWGCVCIHPVCLP